MFSRATVILFKAFVDSKNGVQEKLITVPKKLLFLVLPCLGILSLQARAKLIKSIKGILSCWKLQIAFRSQNKLANVFHFEDHIPKEPTTGFAFKFQCELYNESYYGECVRHLNVRLRGYQNLTID